MIRKWSSEKSCAKMNSSRQKWSLIHAPVCAKPFVSLKRQDMIEQVSRIRCSKAYAKKKGDIFFRRSSKVETLMLAISWEGESYVLYFLKRNLTAFLCTISSCGDSILSATVYHKFGHVTGKKTAHLVTAE